MSDEKQDRTDWMDAPECPHCGEDVPSSDGYEMWDEGGGSAYCEECSRQYAYHKQVRFMTIQLEGKIGW